MASATDRSVPAGWELVATLLNATQGALDAAHRRLATRGHPGVRPSHGYLLQLVQSGVCTATDLAPHLGVSSQAVGQILDDLVADRYVVRTVDPSDRRRKLVRIAARGEELLRLSAEEFGRVRDEWIDEVGADRFSTAYEVLVEVSGGAPHAVPSRPIW